MARPTRERPVLITGSGGFVGTALVRHLRSAYPDRTIATLDAGGAGPSIDIRDAAAVSDIVARVRPAAVIHLAAVAAAPQAQASPHAAWEVNLTGTMNLAEAVMRHAPDARFVFVGSSESYGTSFRIAGRPVGEDVALRPRGVYGATKAAADLMIGQMATDGLDAVRFRPFNHTGPGQSEIYVVSSFARQLARVAAGHEPPLIRVGNLDARRDFLDVRDVVRAYALAALRPLPSDGERVFNLATGAPRKIGDILESLVALCGTAVAIEVDSDRLRPNEIPVASGDPTWAREGLGWQAEIPFERTLADVYAFWREGTIAKG